MSLSLGDKIKVNLVNGIFETTLVGIASKTKLHLIGWTSNPISLGTRGISHAWQYSKEQISDWKKIGYQFVSDIDKYNWVLWADEWTLTKIDNVSNVVKKVVNVQCKRCNEKDFPYAEPNQPDGSFICWSCKKYPFYR